VIQVTTRSYGGETSRRLHDEIVAYTSYIAPTAQERNARLLVITRIRDLVCRRFPTANLVTFGSTAYNLYLPDGYARTSMIQHFNGNDSPEPATLIWL